ncbi:prolyl oligopeptidase family serine peptidase [Mucilaginibacter sp. dw_454]|uniref:alpha/beta hydrolase family esterase n=1 Tax=Mucilaginibacter sp. dw_454 TaxID=2720079 RepID=UPI001BD5B02E|nr:prolyl oligopeptidase family serine peptidase [Mucilaginibacter sp. dw_454]
MRYLLFMLLSFGFFKASARYPGKLIKGDMMVDNNKRSFLTYIPTSVVDKPALVISLHGGFASPKGMFRLANFKPVAEREKFIVVCPASKHFWHDGADLHGIDDVKFIDQLISYMIKTYHVDPDRVYITGISNGGFMTTRLICQLHNRFAAAAVVAATLDVGAGYDLEKPIPVIYMHGTTDPIVSFNGGKVFGRAIYSHKAVVDKWITMDNCSKEPQVTNIPDKAGDGTSILKEEYINHTTGFKVISYTINNGGHTWPDGRQYLPKFIIGKTTRNLNACDEIWNFFKQYKLAQQ